MAASTTKLGGLFVGMTKALQGDLLRLAEQNGRTIQQELRVALREHVERQTANGLQTNGR